MTISMFRRLTIIAIMVLFLTGLGSPLLLHAAEHAKVTTVEGLIENVSNDSIVVRFQRYTITGVPLLKPGGKPALRDELQIGKKVEIFFRNRTITSILVYDITVD